MEAVVMGYQCTKMAPSKYAGVTPRRITPAIREFANRLTSTGNLEYVKVTPQPFAQQSQCYGNCEILQRFLGGKFVLGYSIWTTNDLFLSAEHHCVLRLPDGRLTDPTPDFSGAASVLFAPNEAVQSADSLAEIVGDGELGDFALLTTSPLVSEAVETIRNASHRLARHKSRAILDDVPVSTRELDQYEQAMDKVNQLIDTYYRRIHCQEDNRRREIRRKKHKAERQDKRKARSRCRR
jgi:hypothetical protein